jgi:hypothetical protein
MRTCQRAEMTILTETQIWRRTRHFNAVIVYLAIRYRTHKSLAKALGLTPTAAWKARSRSRRPSVRLALVVAELAAVSVDAVLFGLWPSDRCPHCDGTGRIASRR